MQRHGKFWVRPGNLGGIANHHSDQFRLLEPLRAEASQMNSLGKCGPQVTKQQTFFKDARLLRCLHII